jgi:putative flippase GtrA
MLKTARDLARLAWGSSGVRYLLVGGFCFLVDVGLLWLAHDVLGAPLAFATPIAFLASFAVTYTLQRVIAFASDAKVVPSVARYTALVVFNTIATTAIVWLIDGAGWGWLAGKIVAVVATTVWNYFAYRYWVFVTPPTPSATAPGSRDV